MYLGDIVKKAIFGTLLIGSSLSLGYLSYLRPYIPRSKGLVRSVDDLHPSRLENILNKEPTEQSKPFFAVDLKKIESYWNASLLASWLYAFTGMYLISRFMHCKGRGFLGPSIQHTEETDALAYTLALAHFAFLELQLPYNPSIAEPPREFYFLNALCQAGFVDACLYYLRRFKPPHLMNYLKSIAYFGKGIFLKDPQKKVELVENTEDIFSSEYKKTIDQMITYSSAGQLDRALQFYDSALSQIDGLDGDHPRSVLMKFVYLPLEILFLKLANRKLDEDGVRLQIIFKYLSRFDIDRSLNGWNELLEGRDPRLLCSYASFLGGIEENLRYIQRHCSTGQFKVLDEKWNAQKPEEEAEALLCKKIDDAWSDVVDILLSQEYPFRRIGGTKREVLILDMKGYMKSKMVFERTSLDPEDLEIKFKRSRFAYHAFNDSDKVPKPLALLDYNKVRYMIQQRANGIALGTALQGEDLIKAILESLREYQDRLTKNAGLASEFGVGVQKIDYGSSILNSEFIPEAVKDNLRVILNPLERIKRKIVHGDFHLQNVIYIHDKCFCIIDHEKICLAYPEKDVARLAAHHTLHGGGERILEVFGGSSEEQFFNCYLAYVRECLHMLARSYKHNIQRRELERRVNIYADRAIAGCDFLINNLTSNENRDKLIVIRDALCPYVV